MVDAAVLDDAKRLVANLRAHGDEHNARIVEHLIVASGMPPISPAVIQPPDYISYRQAARGLNVRIQTMKNWVASGKVRSVVVEGEAQVDRRSLLAYLDSLRATRSATVSHSTDEPTRRDLLSLAYPGDTLVRLRELLDARQERTLSVEERDELNRLEEASCRISATRMRAWLGQREHSELPGGGQEDGFARSGPPAQ